MESKQIFTVSNINKYIKMVFDKDPFLSYVAIKGEITNFKAHSSGHLYFTLKDESSTIKCVMFKSAAQNLKVKLQDGAAVVVMGTVSVYDVGGTYQVYVKSVTLDGIGELFAKYEELKKKLEVEGLFSPMYKKKIPFLLLHGTNDTMVSCVQSEAFYDALEREGADVELYLFEDVGHADTAFSQPATQEIVLKFITKSWR